MRRKFFEYWKIKVSRNDNFYADQVARKIECFALLLSFSIIYRFGWQLIWVILVVPLSKKFPNNVKKIVGTRNFFILTLTRAA